ncbi:MAG: hypothetical protein ABSD89_13520 [Halobacteriota archaeon]|jgi:hypothetical protein
MRKAGRLHSMEDPRLELTLIRAADDPPLRNQAYQQELRNFKESLQSQGFKVSFTIDLIEAAAGDSQATYLGGFIIQLMHSPLAGVIAAAAGAWLHARYGRKVRLKVGDIEAEAQTEKQVQRLLEQAEEFQNRNKSKVIHEP